MERNSDLMRHFLSRQDDFALRLRWQATSVAEHRTWRRRFARKLRQLTGAQPNRVPLHVVWDERVETPVYTRHKIYVQSEANYWVPAYYFVPKRRQGRAPAIVCLHGHSGIYPYLGEGSEEQRAKCRELELDYACRFAAQGYVTIAPIQRGWNETSASVDRHESGCQRMVLDSFLTGQTPVGLRCWDASRLADFLQTQDGVDPRRIGVAGLSGGGMVALFWAALEPRVRFAMVAGYYCTFRDSIYAIYHCLCNCVPNILDWGEMREVAALIAPRPLLVISGEHDPIFPIAATRRAYDELRDVYALLDAADRLDHDFFNGPHAWSNRRTGPFLERFAPLPAPD